MDFLPAFRRMTVWLKFCPCAHLWTKGIETGMILLIIDIKKILLCIFSKTYKLWCIEGVQYCTEVHFASFLSGGFITAIVLNQPERKLAKRTSVQCCHHVWRGHWDYWGFLRFLFCAFQYERPCIYVRTLYNVIKKKKYFCLIFF